MPAEAAAAFRILFITLVLAYLFLHPARLPDDLRTDGSFVAGVARWLAATPAIGPHLGSILAVTGLAVVAGAATRVSYPLFVLAFLAWASLRTVELSHHPVSALTMLLIGLMPARWSDAWSVDGWIRRRRGTVAGAPSRAYGFAPWLPGFVMGVTFAAAAWSKLASGPEWILNGTIRYHFVTDLNQALVTWGPALTSLPGVAVGGSLAAVVIEALLVGAAFLRGWRVRAMMGAAALSLLVGFALFQGVIWAGWWLLLLGFVPWALLKPTTAPVSAGDGVGLAQVAVIALIAAQQVVVSARHIEARPLLSAYDMYSTTYESPEQYEAKINPVYRVVGVTAAGAAFPLEGCLLSDYDAVALIDALRRPAGGHASLGVVQPCLDSQPDVVQVVLEADKRVYDWASGTFRWKRRVSTLGPLPLPDRAR